MSVKECDKLNTFIRDNYRCRYKHCQRFTIDSLVLREISRIYPKSFLYHKNWKLKEGESLILYWYYVTSLEHKTSFPNGGDSDPSNLITACYFCNDLKNKYSLETLFWEITEPSAVLWRGLTEYIPQLKEINTFIDTNYSNYIKVENKIADKRLKNEKSIKTIVDKSQAELDNSKIENAFVSTDDLITSQIPIGSILQSKYSNNPILFFGVKDNQPLLASTNMAWCVKRKNSTAIYYKVILWGDGKLPQNFLDPKHQECLKQAEKY